MGSDALLTYRPWTGTFAGPWRASLAITRLGLTGLVRRKLLWVLFAFSLLIFFSFFFGQYLLVWASSLVAEENVRAGGFVTLSPQRLVKDLRDNLKLNGSGETFRNLFWYEGLILNVTLALVGAQIVGNDFRYRSLQFYLAKPLAPRHYIAGKCLAAAVVVFAMTGAPAVVLFVEFGLLEGWSYFWDARGLLAGILGYGFLIAIVLSLLLVAVTSWVQKTVPLVLVWSALFVMAPAVGKSLAAWTTRPNWQLIDLWNNAYVVGNHFLGIALADQPAPAAAAVVLAAVCGLSALALARRVRAVEVV